jgi:hypothetical protein
LEERTGVPVNPSSQEFLTGPNGETDIARHSPFFGKIHKIENPDNLILLPNGGEIDSIRIIL